MGRTENPSRLPFLGRTSPCSTVGGRWPSSTLGAPRFQLSRLVTVRRGGGELGQLWHVPFRGRKHRVTVEDTLSGIKHMHARGYCRPDTTVGRAVSAGAIPIGMAAVSAEPMLTAALIEVGFLDPVSTMLDESLPLTIHEQDEWGAPSQDADDLRALQTISPIHALAAAQRLGTRLLLTAGGKDFRVVRGWWGQRLTRPQPPWVPAKFSAIAEQLAPAGHVMLHTNFEQGHNSLGDRFQSAEQQAPLTAFLIAAVGGT